MATLARRTVDYTPARSTATRAAVAIALLLGLAAPLGAIDIDRSNQRQRHEAWGTSLAWAGNVIGGWNDEQQRDAILDLVFDQQNGVGFNFVRYNIGGGQNPALLGQMRPGGAVPGWVPPTPADISDTSTWVWDNGADPRQRLVLQEALARGANRAEAFALSPPYWLTLSGDTAGGNEGGENLWISSPDNFLSNDDDHYDEYAHYQAEVVKRMRDTDGVYFHTLSPMNESNQSWWVAGGAQEGMFLPRGYKQRLLIEKTGVALANAGLKTTISASEGWSAPVTVADYQALDPGNGGYTKSFVSAINTHTYGGEGNNPQSALAALRTLANTDNKKLYVSEYGNGGNGPLTGGIELARRITRDLNIMQPEGWTYWQSLELECTCNWGLVTSPFGTGNEVFTVKKQYFVQRQFTSHIRPGSQILGTTDSDAVVAYDPYTNTTTIVASNFGSQADDRPYEVLDDDVAFSRAIRTTGSLNFTSLGAAQLAGAVVQGSLPAESVTTYVLHHSPNLVSNAEFAFAGGESVPAKELAGGWNAEGAAIFEPLAGPAADGSGVGVLQIAPGQIGRIEQLANVAGDLTGEAFQFSVDMRLLNNRDSRQVFDADTYLMLEFLGEDGIPLVPSDPLAHATRLPTTIKDDAWRLYRTEPMIAPLGTQHVRAVVLFQNAESGHTDWAYVDNAYLQKVSAVPRGTHWQNDADGVWSDFANWDHDASLAYASHVYLGDVITTTRTLTTDASTSFQELTIDSEHPYVIAGDQSVQVGAQGQQSLIDIRRGHHVIDAPVMVLGNLTVQVLEQASFTMASDVSLAAGYLRKQGAGVLQIASTATLSEGTLQVTPTTSAQVIVERGADLDIDLEVVLPPGFVATLGEEFALVAVDGGGNSFNEIILPGKRFRSSSGITTALSPNRRRR